MEGSWSARRGQYRVTYSIHDEQVLVGVVRISHRGDSIASSGTKSGAQGVRLPLTDAGVTILSAGEESGLPIRSGGDGWVQTRTPLPVR